MMYERPKKAFFTKDRLQHTSPKSQETDILNSDMETEMYNYTRNG